MRIIHEGRVEDAVRSTLRTWLSTFLNDLEREDGRTPGSIVRPKQWVRTTDALSIPKQQLPTVAIVGDGWLDEPDWDTEEGAAVWWAITIAIFAKGRDRDDALDNARILGAAARQALWSKPALGGFAAAIRLMGAASDLVDANRERTLAGSISTIGVLVAETHSTDNGPALPDPEETYPSHPNPPAADTVTVTTTRLEME